MTYEDIQKSNERLRQGLHPKTAQEAMEMAEKIDLGEGWREEERELTFAT